MFRTAWHEFPTGLGEGEGTGEGEDLRGLRNFEISRVNGLDYQIPEKIIV